MFDESHNIESVGQNGVSVAVVCYNEERRIGACLGSLLAQDFSAERMEILVVDNDSTDQTLAVVAEVAGGDSRVRIVTNGRRGIASSRNVALREARYPFLAFTDADCLAPAHWLSGLMKRMREQRRTNPKVAAVGGGSHPPAEGGRFFASLTLMLNTYLGSHGSVQGMRYKGVREVDHLPTVNILYDRKVVLGVGGFDESFGNIGEDEDLSARLEKAGYRLVYIPHLEVEHRSRESWSSWVRNMFTYGKGRVWLLRKHPNRLHWAFVLPMLWVATLVIGPLLFRGRIGWAAWAYFPVVAAYSACVAWKKGHVGLFAMLFACYAGTHLAYGWGEWYGLFFRRKSTADTSSKEHGLAVSNT